MCHNFLKAHAISGCDTVAYIHGIGKGKIVKKMLSGMKLTNLEDIDANIDEIVSEATVFISACYGVKDATSVSETRVAVGKTKTATRHHLYSHFLQHPNLSWNM